jgi:hypothetical protein
MAFAKFNIAGGKVNHGLEYIKMGTTALEQRLYRITFSIRTALIERLTKFGSNN